MKKLLLFLGVFVMAVSCDKDDDAAVSWASIETIVTENYWDEKIYLVYEEGSETHQSEDLFSAFDMVGTTADWNVMISPPYFDGIYGLGRKANPFYVDWRGWIRSFTVEDELIFYDHYFKIEYDSANRFVKIMSPKRDLRFKNAVAGSELRIVSATPDEVVFDAPLKEYLRYAWYLDNYTWEDLDPEHGRRYLGIRVVWRKLTPIPELEEAIYRSSY